MKNKEDIKAIAKEVAIRNNCVNDSYFSVAAVLVTKEGKIYTGCNIENNGIQSTCAERVAFAKALSENEQKFDRIFILGYQKNKSKIKNKFINKFCSKKKFQTTWPCGYCRDFIASYVDSDFVVCTIDENDSIIEKAIKELVPFYNWDSKVRNNESTRSAELICIDENGREAIYNGTTISDMHSTIMVAEKVAILKALSDGITKYVSLSIKDKNGNLLYPDANAMQLYNQYVDGDFRIIINKNFENENFNKEKSKVEDKITRLKIEEVLPDAFKF